MENISTGLKLAIGIIITLLIISAGVGIYMYASGAFDDAKKGLTEQSASLKDVQFSKYNATVDGTDIIEAARKYKVRDSFEIAFQTKKTAAYYAIASVSSSSSPKRCFTVDSTSVKLTTSCANNTKTLIDTTATPAAGGDVAWGYVAVSDIEKQDSDFYVNPTAKFKALVLKDENGIERVLQFTQQ